MKKIKALVLFSGGLDSRLVVRMLQEQNIDVELIFFKLPFGCGCCNDSQCNFNFSQTTGTKLTMMDCTKGKLFKEYLQVIKNPKFARGTGMNPCIDCKIFMFKKAKEYADKQKPKIEILATGEVLGERPLSQTGKALSLIDKAIGYELLRPLSAKLLPETQAEKQKLVDRSKFLDISGRRRRVQLDLAKKFNIKFPSPAGGCLLCEKIYASRLGDFFSNEKKIIPEKLSTLGKFRHFRSQETNAKILLGKNYQENMLLEQLNKKIRYNLLASPETRPGPTALFENKKDKALVEELMLVYSGKDLEVRKRFDKIRL